MADPKGEADDGFKFYSDEDGEDSNNADEEEIDPLVNLRKEALQ